MKKHNLRLKYILVGASGTGKSTMASILEKELGLRRCITSTTRPKRPGEKDGVDYYFCAYLEPDTLFEHAAFGGFDYGITYDELAKGDFVILEPQGVHYYLEHYPAPLTVIKLQRHNIHIDASRKARDRAAGFDRVAADLVISGETIADMASNLLGAIVTLEEHRKPSVDDQIVSAEQIRNTYPRKTDRPFVVRDLHKR